MKIKFLFFTSLLLFARGCDFYSTSLWFFDNPSHETNPLTQFFGVGWTGLVLTNIVIVGLVIYSFYYYSFKHTPPTLSRLPDKLTDFVSQLYFNQPQKLHWIFYKMPKNKTIWLGHTGYVLIRVLILASFLAAGHNLGQFYGVPAYAAFRDFVQRPLFVIYGLIVLAFAYFSYRVWSMEYALARKAWDFPPNDA